MTTQAVPIDELVSEFNEQGYVICQGLLPASLLDGVRQEMCGLVDRCAQQLMEQRVIEDPLTEAPFDERLWLLLKDHLDKAPLSFREDLHLRGMYPVFFHQPLLDLVEAFLGPEIRLYPNYTVRPKLPEWDGTQVLWHQDGGYTGQDAGALTMVNVWSPLVPARAENGCMQFIPGSHKFGMVEHVPKKHYLQIVDQMLQPHLHKAVDIELDPGDVVLFSNLLYHCGQPNRTQRVRWSMDWRYQDATQPTQRVTQGHIARSRRDPSRVVPSAEHWTKLGYT